MKNLIKRFNRAMQRNSETFQRSGFRQWSKRVTTLTPGTEVKFEYGLAYGYRLVRGTVLEPSEYTRPGEVRVQWDDGFGITNMARERLMEVTDVD